jgi:hypothetical protein
MIENLKGNLMLHYSLKSKHEPTLPLQKSTLRFWGNYNQPAGYTRPDEEQESNSWRW